MSKQPVLEYVGKYKGKIDQAIEQEIDKRLKEVGEISPHLVPIVSAMKELSVGGKRLRGLLTILGFEIAGGEVNDEVIKAASMMEIFHLGLLIQDDFMDKDTLRRGVKTINARYQDQHTGNFVAMLAGDYTFGWGMEVISNLKFDAVNLNNAIAVWGKYFTRVGYGQTLDGLAIADDKTVLQILALKSGEYSCVLPLQLGAALAGASKDIQSNLFEYGMELGWVFQLRDDYLAEYGDSDKTGKPVGNDRREGKKTFATMYGKEKTVLAIKEHWDNGLDSISDFKGSTLKVMEGLLEWMATREN